MMLFYHGYISYPSGNLINMLIAEGVSGSVHVVDEGSVLHFILYLIAGQIVILISSTERKISVL